MTLQNFIGGQESFPEMPMTYCAIPREEFSYRFIISRYVLRYKEEIPINPFMLFDYRLGKDNSDPRIIEACHQLVARSDKMRVFGNEEKDGVAAEIEIAEEYGIDVVYHDIDNFR